MERLDGSETLSSLSVAYDGSGRPVSYTDQDGLTKSFERDAFGKVLKEKFPDGSECAYSYDALGRRTSVIDENGHEIKFGWGRFGLSSRTTAAGQLTDYVRDDLGFVKEVVSKWNGSEDRKITSEYDEFGRLVRADYGRGEVEKFAYDKWNRLAKHTRGKTEETYKYDHFGRLVEKRENGLTTSYTYDAWGNRLSRVTQNRRGETVSRESRKYDRFGRLAETAAGFGSKVTYAYDSKGRLARQVVDGSPIDYEYTKYGQLAAKHLGGKLNPDASVIYEYSKSGRIVARTANGVRQTYVYDKKGQLLAVKDANGNVLERYWYDKAGNMLKKQILRSGRAGAPRTPQSDDYITTTFAFDDANQLVSSTTDGVTTRYAYDAAGRLVKEGNKTYRYGYLDKVMSVSDGDTTRTFTYHADGQLASANYGDASESFVWDGLALIQRGDEQFVNEPHVGGGNPVASSKGTSYFNDMLGTTVGSKSNGKYSAAALTAFGENHPTTEPPNHQTFFTGKPYVEGLGHAFLMRNYRASLAKWQTVDPIGYPDGWNALAYCLCCPHCAIDYAGAFLLTCHDFNAVGFAIHSASELTVGHVGADASGGVFSVYLRDVQITPSGSVFIDLALNLSIDPNVRHDSKFQSGDVSEYGEHTGSQNNAYGDNMTWESVYAHEKGHAEVFFKSEIPQIRSILSSINIDDGSRSLAEIVSIVKGVIVTVHALCSERSNKNANSATERWYADQPRWRLLEDFNGGTVKRWIKE